MLIGKYPALLIKEIARPAVDSMKLALHRARWRARNSHNFTTAETLFPLDQVRVGQFTYGPLSLRFFGSPGEAVEIGSFCSIANDVSILAGGEHPLDHPTTYPLRRNLLGDADVGSASRGRVEIGDDVWIGHGATILSGVRVGQGAVIGAGSVVRNSIPPYAIYARGGVVKFRFVEEVRASLLGITWGRISRDEVARNIDLLEAVLEDQQQAEELVRKCATGLHSTMG